jgi:hypothetical protein
MVSRLNSVHAALAFAQNPGIRGDSSSLFLCHLRPWFWNVNIMMLLENGVDGIHRLSLSELLKSRLQLCWLLHVFFLSVRMHMTFYGNVFLGWLENEQGCKNIFPCFCLYCSDLEALNVLNYCLNCLSLRTLKRQNQICPHPWVREMPVSTIAPTTVNLEFWVLNWSPLY